MPKFPAKLKKGEQSVKHTKSMMALCWKDKQQVYMLKTVNTFKMKETKPKEKQEKKKKPIAVIDYSNNMKTVDQVDMQMSYTESLWKTMKWYKKVFFHLLNVSIHNGFVSFKKVKSSKKMQLQSFDCKLSSKLQLNI